jgi:TolB protein
MRLFAILAVLVAGMGLVPLARVRADNPTPPGKIAYIHNGAIWTWSGGDTSELISGTDISDARWSPSGNSMLYVRSGNSYSDLYVYDLGSQTQTQLTFNKPDAQEGTPEYVAAASWAIDPSWSSSGVIAFISDAQSSNNSLGLWMIDSVYSGAPYLAPSAKSEDNVDSPSLSPDGSVAAYVEQVPNYDTGIATTNVVLRDLTDGQIYPIAGAADSAFDPAIGPDGHSIFFAKRDATGMTDLWLANRQGGAAVQLTSGLQATNPVWSPDGAWIAFIRMIDFNFQVWVMPMTGATPGAPFELFDPGGIDAPSGLSWIVPSAS